MEITELADKKITIQLDGYEYDTLQTFANTLNVDFEDIFQIYLRSLYNFVVQYLSMTDTNGPRSY